MKKNYILYFLSVIFFGNSLVVLSNNISSKNNISFNLTVQQQCEANGINFQSAVRFVRTLIDLVKENNKQKVADLGDYPITVNVINVKTNSIKHYQIENKKEFIQMYNSIVTDVVKQAIIKADPNDLICNYEGAAFANGTIWLWADDQNGAFNTINVISK